MALSRFRDLCVIAGASTFDNLTKFGLAIVVIFLASWAISAVLYRWDRGHDASPAPDDAPFFDAEPLAWPLISCRSAIPAMIAIGLLRKIT